MQNTLYHSSTNTTGREENSAETPDTLTTQAPKDTNAPLLSAAPCSAVDCSKTLKERLESAVKRISLLKEISTLGDKILSQMRSSSVTPDEIASLADSLMKAPK